MSMQYEPGLVTAVVASYNHEKFLPDRMRSLLSQTYPKLDILVIDDCSPDNSVEILRSFESNQKLKIIVKKQNSGWASVSNEGIQLSNGEYILFANCDDACDEEMISNLVSALEENPTAGLAFCQSRMIDENNGTIGNDFDVREKSFQYRCSVSTLLTKSEATKFLLRACIIPNLSAVLFRRKIFDQIGGFSEAYKVCCDWDLFFRITERYDVAYVALPLNHFRQHAKTVRSATKSKIILEEYFRLLLHKIRLMRMPFWEAISFRYAVMHIWSVNLIPPATEVIQNIPYHLALIYKIDSVSLILLPFAIFIRIFEVIFIKAPKKIVAR